MPTLASESNKYVIVLNKCFVFVNDHEAEYLGSSKPPNIQQSSSNIYEFGEIPRGQQLWKN